MCRDLRLYGMGIRGRGIASVTGLFGEIRSDKTYCFLIKMGDWIRLPLLVLCLSSLISILFGCKSDREKAYTLVAVGCRESEPDLSSVSLGNLIGHHTNLASGSLALAATAQGEPGADFYTGVEYKVTD